MSVLHRAVKEKRRVKVWIRSHRCMRGICKGYLLAFDKHYNLVSLLHESSRYVVIASSKGCDIPSNVTLSLYCTSIK